MAERFERFERFRITVTGDHLAPESLTLRHLTSLLKRYESLLRSIAEEQGAPEARRLALRLTGIGRGSVAAELCAPECSVTPALDRLAARHAGSPFTSLAAEQNYRRLCSLLGARRWSLATQRSSGAPIMIAAAKTGETITGRTTIYGTCLSVGGDRPTARIRPDGQEDTARVVLETRDQAKTLAAALYGAIGIEGEAVWDATTGNLRQIRAETIVVLADATAGDVIEAMRRTAGRGWDSIDDPERFVREIRCE